jgi:hypothetical protein
MDKLSGKKHNHHSLTWPGTVLLVGIASLEFLLPPAWARWVLAVGFAVACFALLAIASASKEENSPGFGVALALSAGGALIFWIGSWSLPPEAFFSGLPAPAEAPPRTWLTCGAGFFIAGVAFGAWRAVLTLVQWLRGDS